MAYDQEELVKWFNVNAVDFEENSKVTLPPNPGSQFQNIGEYKLYHTGNIIDSIEIYCADTTFNGSFKITSADYRKFNGVKDSVLVGCLLEDERRFIVMKRSTGW